MLFRTRSKMAATEQPQSSALWSANLDSRYEGAEIGDIPSRALLLGPLPLRWLFYRKFQREPGRGASNRRADSATRGRHFLCI